MIHWRDNCRSVWSKRTDYNYYLWRSCCKQYSLLTLFTPQISHAVFSPDFQLKRRRRRGRRGRRRKLWASLALCVSVTYISVPLSAPVINASAAILLTLSHFVFLRRITGHLPMGAGLVRHKSLDACFQAWWCLSSVSHKCCWPNGAGDRFDPVCEITVGQDHPQRCLTVCACRTATAGVVQCLCCVEGSLLLILCKITVRSGGYDRCWRLEIRAIVDT